MCKRNLIGTGDEYWGIMREKVNWHCTPGIQYLSYKQMGMAAKALLDTLVSGLRSRCCQRVLLVFQVAG